MRYLCLQLTVLHLLKSFSGPSWHLPRQPLLCQPLSSRFALQGLRCFEQLFLDKVYREPFGSWTSAPKTVDVHTKKCVSCGPGDGAKLLEPWAFGRKGHQDVRKGGLSLRGVAFMTVSAVLMVSAVLDSTLPSFRLSYKIQDKEATVTALTVLAISTAVVVSVVTATPLKLNPPFRHSEVRNVCRKFDQTLYVYVVFSFLLWTSESWSTWFALVRCRGSYKVFFCDKVHRDVVAHATTSWKHMSGGRNWLPKFVPILFFRRVSRFPCWGVSGHLVLQQAKS